MAVSGVLIIDDGLTVVLDITRHHNVIDIPHTQYSINLINSFIHSLIDKPLHQFTAMTTRSSPALTDIPWQGPKFRPMCRGQDCQGQGPVLCLSQRDFV